MGRPSLSIAFAFLVLTSCTHKKNDVLQQAKDTAVARTTQCTVPNADGVRCDQKTCKKDEVSDCGIFRDRCKASGHDYDGNNDSGTCTRKQEIG